MGKWVVLGKPECSWCDSLSDLLHLYDIEFVYMNVIEKYDLVHFLVDCGLTTVPQVYHNGYHVGGYDDVKNYLEALNDIGGLSDYSERPPIYPAEWEDDNEDKGY